MKNLTINRLNRLISDLQNACEGTPYRIEIPSYYRESFLFCVVLSRSANDATWHSESKSVLSFTPEIYVENHLFSGDDRIEIKVQTVSYGSLTPDKLAYNIEAMKIASVVAVKLQRIVDEAFEENAKTH